MSIEAGGVDRAARLQEITERRDSRNISAPHAISRYTFIFGDATGRGYIADARQQALTDIDFLIAEVVRLRDVDAALQRARELHAAYDDPWARAGAKWCPSCQRTWPCDTAAVLGGAVPDRTVSDERGSRRGIRT